MDLPKISYEAQRTSDDEDDDEASEGLDLDDDDEDDVKDSAIHVDDIQLQCNKKR